MKKRVKILLWILGVIVLLGVGAFCFLRRVTGTTCCTEVIPDCCDRNASEYEKCICGGTVTSNRERCSCGVLPLFLLENDE